METLKLEGETLGLKRQHYNKLVKEYTSKNASQEIKRIDYNEPDINNLFKIDIASEAKDVDYILEVLKSEDMLYVSRALKQSKWLITDEKYADIINSDYVHVQLLPQMTSRAGHKLLLIIRLNLKDEKRVEQFYKYYEDKKELKTALKWLSNCSIPFIEYVVERHSSDISHDIVKRLCEKSDTILDVYARNNDQYTLRNLLTKSTFLLNKNVDKYISTICSMDYIPTLSPKITKIIMKTKPDIILDNFEKFAAKVNIPTFVKFLKKEEINDFLLKHLDNDKLKSWFSFETLKHFICRMPNEDRFNFIKSVCINKSNDASGAPLPIFYMCDLTSNRTRYRKGRVTKRVPQLSNANVYKWYKFAPFSTAFTELKKLIRLESNPSERNQILAVLITSTRGNLQNLQTVLQYYGEKHMNEPFKFKSHFVNIVLAQTNSHKIDNNTWNILNNIFYSMEVYNDTENNVQICLKYIIVYKVTHNMNVPDVVEKKFNFDTLKSIKSKLNHEEREKVFEYLYQLKWTQIKNHTMNTESDLKEILQHIKSVLNLLSDWDKNLLHYCIILEKIKEIVEIKNKKSWSEDLSDIYNVNKSWRKHLFQESLFLNPTQETCINALKHGPEILESCKNSIFLNDSLVSIQFLNKLRVYWPQTLAKIFEETFQNHLHNNTKHKSSVRGLCILLPKQQLNDILKKYIPQNTKIMWGETSDLTLNIQKHFARYMYLARPHPPVDIVLSYAKGDYLQYVLPSVHSILFNKSSTQSIKHMPTILDSPVSLQKHGLNIAFAKIKMHELLPICHITWKSSKNSSIRTTVFKLIFDLLCKEQNESNIEEIWHVLDTFIEDLTFDENKIIYITLSHASKVPLSVKKAFCIKSYRYLKTLPSKANCDILCKSVVHSTLDIMEFLDLDFVAEVIFDSFDKEFTKPYYSYTDVISTYLLSTKSEGTQTERYNKIFVPLLNKCLALKQSTTEDSQLHLKYNFNGILKQLHKNLNKITINKNMIVPIKLFSDIRNDLKKNFSIEDNYELIITWELAVKYMALIDKYIVEASDNPIGNQTMDKVDNTKGNIIYTEVSSEFSRFCMDLLKEEIKNHFSSVYMFFSRALKQLFNLFDFDIKTELATIKAIQEHANIIDGQLLVLKLLPKYVDEKDGEYKKICESLQSHPCAEVRMHYQQMLKKTERYL